VPVRSHHRVATPVRLAPPGEPPFEAVTRLLRGGGLQAAPEALALAAADVGCTSLSLRIAPARTLTAAGAEPAGGGWMLDVPVPVPGIRAVLGARAAAPFTVAQANRLTAYADLLALVLEADPQARSAEAARVVLDAEADRAELASALRDSIGQALVTVRYAVDRAIETDVGCSDLDEPVRAALTAFREAHRDLRTHSLQDGLRAALRELAVQSAGDRPADGRPALRLTVEAGDPDLDRVPPAVAVTVERIARAVLRDAGGVVRLTATCRGGAVKLQVESADIACDASELDRWSRRVSALGGDLRLGTAGVELDLPVELDSDHEGRHDDRPDLRRPPGGSRGSASDRRERSGRRTGGHRFQR
jgi:hypothetical protein